MKVIFFWLMVPDIAKILKADNYRLIIYSLFAFPTKEHPTGRETPREETITHTRVHIHIY